MNRCPLFLLVPFCLSLAPLTVAQTLTETASALPRLVRFGGTAKDLSGNPLTGVVGITFALYSEQSGGAALWQETQNLTADGNGHYTALLGATKSEGLPANLFTNEQAHWVGVQVEGQAEQPRVLLVSSPYALKAGDAETVGGLPPSAFVLAAPATGSAAAPPTPPGSATSAALAPAVTGTGTTDFIPLWTSTSALGSSVLFQSGTGATAKVGVNTSTPAATLDVGGGATIRGTLGLPATGTATASAGQTSEKLNMQASVFNSSTGTAVPQTFELKAEPANNDTAAATGVLSVLYGSGSNPPADTGLQIATNGLITFATGQTFPGAGGTITGVTAGTDLTGGGTTGTVTLNLDTTKVPLLAAPNIFTTNQTVNGSVTATSFSGNGSALTNLAAVTSVGSGSGLTGGPITSTGSLSIATGGVTNAMLTNASLTVTPGTDLTGGGPVALGGSTTLNLDTTKVPQLAVPNTFMANQTVTGSVTATSFSGNGSALTNLQGGNVQGAVATATNALNLRGLLPGAYATTGIKTFTGNQSISGNLTATGSVSGASATFTGLVTASGALLPASGTATATQSFNSQPLDAVASASA